MTAPGKAGHAAVFAEVVKQRRLIRAVLWRHGVRASMLDDLEQDVLVTAHRRIGEGGFRPPDPGKPLAENVAAWVSGIAKWTAIESKRTQARHDKIFGAPTRENPLDVEAIRVPSPESRFMAQEELHVIAQLKMSQTRREVVRLTAEGYSAREISELLGIPEGTAATHLKRARAAYAAAVERERAKRKG